MAIYQQKVIHTSGMFGCLRKPSNNVGGDSDLDGVVDGGCDNCYPSMPGGLPGGEWNPWQEDYDRDGMGDACDPCPFQFTPPNAPCVGPPFLPEPEVWTGIAVTTTLAELPIYGSERLGLMRPNAMRDTSFYPGAIFTRQLDKKAYELKDHLGNVRVVVSDLKKRENDVGTSYTVIVKSVNNYYAFGMLEEGMSGSSGGYRYGFQGQEMDNEISGVGNLYTAEYWEYDSRLGRRWNMDPKKSASSSPYSTFSGNPVLFSDPNGDTVKIEYQTGFFLFRWLGLGSTHSANYVDGKLYDDKGEELSVDYESSNVDSFLGETVGALDEIRGVSIGQESLTELQSSLNVFVITSGRYNTFTAYDDSKSHLIQQVNGYMKDFGVSFEEAKRMSKTIAGIENTGSGGIIRWDGEGGLIPTLSGMQRDRLTALFHEISHGIDANRGLLDDALEPPEYEPEIKRSEWQAVYRENIFRQQMNLPLREFYAVEEGGVFDFQGKGGGPRMLSPSNEPILPSWYYNTKSWY